MGKMNDGSECVMCELYQDLDSWDDLHLLCADCFKEVTWPRELDE